jgi:gas vesicle protein
MQRQDNGRQAFVVGMLAGTCVGAGLAMWLAPKGPAELGRRLTASGKDLAQRATDEIQQASTRVSDAAADLAGAVARGAHEVEEYATVAMGGRH